MQDLAVTASAMIILNGRSNYREWAANVKATAMIGGFWNAILDKNDTDTDASADIKDKIAQREMKASGLILKTVNQVILLELDALTSTTADPNSNETTTDTQSVADPSASAMWVHLKSTYEKKDGVASLLDFKLLFRADLVDDGTLGDQLNRLWELRARCATNELELKDWVFAVLTLVALPSSYSHIPDSLLASGDIKDLKAETVRAKVMETEIRRNGESNSSANAISLSTKPPDVKGK